MATAEDFSAEEWEAISDGPVYAGMMVTTASKGGTIREMFSMSKTWAEARQQHGESELLDAIVAEKPKLDEKPGTAIELHNAGIRMLQEAVRVLEAKSPDDVDTYRGFVTGLAERVAQAHEERGQQISPGEQTVLDEIAGALGS
ncbi:MAG: hypothetical protein U0R24_00715 [Solirubrobacterales bacterium]